MQHLVNGEMIDIKPEDIVSVEAISVGYDNVELRQVGDKFKLSGKYFQASKPSWVEILEVYEAKKELVEQITVGARKGGKSK